MHRGDIIFKIRETGVKVKEKERQEKKRTKKNNKVRISEKKLKNMTQIMTETHEQQLLESNKNGYQSYHFGDTEFLVPHRYISLGPRGVGAQGAVW